MEMCSSTGMDFPSVQWAAVRYFSVETHSKLCMLLFPKMDCSTVTAI